VTGYSIERCLGSGCSNFAQISNITASPYYDATLAASSTISYRIRATDAAGNLSTYSNVVSTSTPASSPDCN
jgi:hypothetical protein